MSDAEVSDYWYLQAFEAIGNDPYRAIALYLTKVWYFFQGQEIINDRWLYYAGNYSLLMKLTIWRAGLNFPTGLLFPMMLGGFVLAYRQRRRLLVPALYVIGLGAIVAAFFVCSRFRQPVIPVASLYATYLVVGTLSLWSQSKRRLILPLTVAMLARVNFKRCGN